MGKGESLWERGGELNDELQSWYLPLYWMQQAEREQARCEGRLAPFAQALVQAADTIRASAREILPGCTSGDLRMAAEVPFYELTLACIGHGPLTPPECDLVRMYLNNRPGVGSLSDVRAALAAGRPLFAADAAISEDGCGAFWKRIAAQYPGVNVWYPEPVEDLLNAAHACYRLFSEPGDADRRFSEIWDGFEAARPGKEE
jgi:hypothetical protein